MDSIITGLLLPENPDGFIYPALYWDWVSLFGNALGNPSGLGKMRVSLTVAMAYRLQRSGVSDYQIGPPDVDENTAYERYSSDKPYC